MNQDPFDNSNSGELDISIPIDGPPVLLIRLQPRWISMEEEIEPGYSRNGNGWHEVISSEDLYDSARAWWKLNPLSVSNRQISHVVVVAAGVTRALYRISNWIGPRESDGRWAFAGERIETGELVDAYIGLTGKRVLLRKGEANPVKYWPPKLGNVADEQSSEEPEIVGAVVDNNWQLREVELIRQSDDENLARFAEIEIETLFDHHELENLWPNTCEYDLFVTGAHLKKKKLEKGLLKLKIDSESILQIPENDSWIKSASGLSSVELHLRMAEATSLGFHTKYLCVKNSHLDCPKCSEATETDFRTARLGRADRKVVLEISRKIISLDQRCRSLQRSLDEVQQFARLNSQNTYLSDFETVLFETPASLVESRKGVRVSTSTGHNSGRTNSSVRVGPVRLGSSSGSTSSRTTISYPSQDELTKIDDGRFQFSTRGISFIGRQFTRNVEFKKLLGVNLSAREILVASKSSQKIWIARLQRPFPSKIIEGWLDAVEQMPDGRLDGCTNQRADEIEMFIHNLVNSQKREIAKEYWLSRCELNSRLRSLNEIAAKSVIETHLLDEVKEVCKLDPIDRVGSKISCLECGSLMILGVNRFAVCNCGYKMTWLSNSY